MFIYFCQLFLPCFGCLSFLLSKKYRNGFRKNSKIRHISKNFSYDMPTTLDYKHFIHLDCVGTSAVTGSHIAVALGHGSRHGQVAIFAVHVVGSRPEMIKLNNGLLRITRSNTEAWLERVLWLLYHPQSKGQ